MQAMKTSPFLLMILAPTIIMCQGPECMNGAVRLADGRTEFEGRVEVCVGEEWGTVCDDEWDASDALVVCRQMGFNLRNFAYPAFFGGGTGPIHLDDLECNGTENQLLDCCFAENDCEHFEDAGVICPSNLCENGTVRLVDGLTRFEGRVEVCFDGVWGSICSAGWEDNIASATVICRELGIYLSLGAVAIPNHSRGPGPIFVAQVTCTGGEDALNECDYEFTDTANHFCSIRPVSSLDPRDAGVHCLQGCNDTAVRLISRSRDSSQGRVEVCLNNTWGTVCSEGWDYSDSLVVCKQLGFSSNYAVRGAPFPAESRPIHFSHVGCTGSEQSVLSCSATQLSAEGPHSPTCDHSMDVSIACSRSPCADGDVRLMGGPDNREGRVQTCLDGKWRSVCNDSWSEKETGLVCQQLGYTDGRAFSTTYVSDTLEDSLLVSCLGNEPTLSNCSLRTTDQCVNLAGVFCSAPCFSNDHSVCCESRYECFVESSTPQCYCNAQCFEDRNCCSDILYTDGCIPDDGCVNGEVRLFGGSSPSNGRLETCVGEHWAIVCAPQPLGTTTATLACSQLGYTSTDVVVFPANSFYLLHDPNSVLVHGLSCMGSESLISDCYYQSLGNGSCEGTSLACSVECDADSVRLVGGSSSRGRVEVCHRGVWASLYTRGWNRLSAKVLCKQLGFDDEAATTFAVPERSGVRVCTRATCTGDETTINECMEFGSPDCFTHQLAGATCPSPPSSQACITPLPMFLLLSICLYMYLCPQ